MDSYTDLLQIIKHASQDALETRKPMSVFFGVVTNAAPLELLVEQKLPLKAAQLIVPQHLTDHELEVTPDTWTTTVSSSPESHSHKISGRLKLTVHNALKMGDKVILLRIQGGQKFVVLDRQGGRDAT